MSEKDKQKPEIWSVICRIPKCSGVPVFRYRVLVHAEIAIPHYLYQERIYIRATPIFGVTPAAQTPFNSSVVGFGQEILFEPLLKYEQLNLKNYDEADNVRFSSARSYVRQR